ncbi:hypothetical protein ZWY2020_011041 [Hordeum vulgare]|nr:hypothetical protein ZWY2020_011041 [Hordeum vulgare]
MAAFTTIFGSIIVDSYVGRFWTIAAVSMLYQLGMLGLVVSVLTTALYPMACTVAPSTTACQSLLFTALGSNGIHLCVVAFGADQFSVGGRRPSGKQKWSFFNFCFITMGLAVLLALTVVVYI